MPLVKNVDKYLLHAHPFVFEHVFVLDMHASPQAFPELHQFTSGEMAMFLFKKDCQIGFSGIGLSQRRDHAKRFVHLDTKPRKA